MKESMIDRRAPLSLCAVSQDDVFLKSRLGCADLKQPALLRPWQMRDGVVRKLFDQRSMSDAAVSMNRIALALFFECLETCRKTCASDYCERALVPLAAQKCDPRGASGARAARLGTGTPTHSARVGWLR